MFDLKSFLSSGKDRLWIREIMSQRIVLKYDYRCKQQI